MTKILKEIHSLTKCFLPDKDYKYWYNKIQKQKFEPKSKFDFMSSHKDKKDYVISSKIEEF